MAINEWAIVRLASSHRRDQFDCGVDTLNTFVRRFARQNDQKGIARVYVAVYPGEQVVRGFYTLSSSAVAQATMPEAEQRRLPRYPVPTALIGRLAVDQSAQGRGLGRELLMDAIFRVLKAADAIGIYALEVDAKDDNARTFYAQYGFESLQDADRHMFLSVKVAMKAFKLPLRE